jgi:hypothetical protein
MVRPAISSVIRCIASRKSTGAPETACSFAIVASVDHVRDQGAHRAGRERRRQGAALMFPGAAFGDQQSLAEHRPQHADRGRGADIVFIIVDQHMPDRLRRVQDKAVAAEKTGLDDVLFIGTRTPGIDGVFSHRHHPPEQAHGPARRARRHQRLPCGRGVVGFGNAHGWPRNLSL